MAYIFFVRQSYYGGGGGGGNRCSMPTRQNEAITATEVLFGSNLLTSFLNGESMQILINPTHLLLSGPDPFFKDML